MGIHVHHIRDLSESMKVKVNHLTLINADLLPKPLHISVTHIVKTYFTTKTEKDFSSASSFNHFSIFK
jgi:hypothetical protein